MRIARKLMLLAMMAIAATAFMASSASAEIGLPDAVEITDEDLGTHCGAVTPTPNGATGGCFLHADSETGTLVSLELFGEALTECTNSFDARINEDGHGYIYNQVFGGGAPCVAVPCNAVTGPGFRPWEVAVQEPRPGVEHLIANFCVVVGGVQIDCTIEVGMHIHSHSEVEFFANQSPCFEDDTLHVTGHWYALANPNTTPPRREIEIRHPGNN